MPPVVQYRGVPFKWISLQISKRILVSNLVMIYMLLQKVIQHDKNKIPQHQGISGLLWISDRTRSEKKYVLAVFKEQYDEFDKHSSGSVSKWPIYTFHSHQFDFVCSTAQKETSNHLNYAYGQLCNRPIHNPLTKQ